MRRLILIILNVLLAIFLLFAYLRFSIGYSISDHAAHYSKGIDESKENGMFIGYYKPLKDSLVLDTFTLNTEKIWYEKNWTTSHNFIFQKSIKIDSGIHLIAPYISLLLSDLKVDVFQKVYYPACNTFETIDGLGFSETIATRPDSLVLFFVTDYGDGYKDSITYLREY